MYLNLLACEIMVREACQVIARSPHICDVTFLDQGYHDRVDEGRAAIQAAIDLDRPTPYDGVLLGYGLCNNLLVGLRARSSPLIVPRAHDCITLFLGSRERYNEEFAGKPGTYWYTSGWLECRTRRGRNVMDQTSGVVTATYEQFVEQYGEDNAQFLIEALSAWTEHYKRGALIFFEHDHVPALEAQVRAICEDRGWQYEAMTGDIGLLERLVAGEWDPKEYLVVPPGHEIVADWHGGVVAAVPSEERP
ncbi:MAG TPA: hypothetical protein DCZ72_05750 [Armatimonadetes bacterium]|nr:hypothetical protein [Armatimonadota bacterium]